jgi:hypothetical protein
MLVRRVERKLAAGRRGKANGTGELLNAAFAMGATGAPTLWKDRLMRQVQSRRLAEGKGRVARPRGRGSVPGQDVSSVAPDPARRPHQHRERVCDRYSRENVALPTEPLVVRSIRDRAGSCVRASIHSSAAPLCASLAADERVRRWIGGRAVKECIGGFGDHSSQLGRLRFA